MPASRLTTGVLFLLSVSPAAAQGPQAATPQRPTFTNDTSTAAPGTVEIEYGATILDGAWQMPVSVKIGSAGTGAVLRNSEFRVSFDAVDSVSGNGRTERRFGDRLILGYRKRLWNGQRMSFAIAPRVAKLLRGNEGIRAGVAGIAALNFGRNSLSVNISGSGASKPGPANPQRLVELDSDISRPLGKEGWRSRTAVFGGFHADTARRQTVTFALGQGVTFRVRPNVVLDTAIRETGFGGGRRDVQLLFGITANLGRWIDR